MPKADYRDCTELAHELAERIEKADGSWCYEGDDLPGQFVPVLQPIIGELQQLREQNTTILSGLRWTGDGYEWTGAEYDYRLKPEESVERMRQDRESLRSEIDRMRQFARRQAEEIESLNGMADAVEVLRDIGKVFGCGHVDGPDERRQLVNCIEQEFARVNADVERLRGDVKVALDEASKRFYEVHRFCDILKKHGFDNGETA